MRQKQPAPPRPERRRAGVSGPVTAPQQRALDALRARGTATAGDIARDLWPDSPGWDRRTRGRSGNRNGALGGTLPMKAAGILWRLHARGLARQTYGEENVVTWTAVE